MTEPIVLHSRLLDSRGIPHGFFSAAVPTLPLHDQLGAEEPAGLGTILSKLNAEALTLPIQVHGEAIWQVDQRPERIFAYGPEADAAITSVQGLAVGVRTADCVPILLATEDGKLVAAVHAGWRSCYAEIIPKAVNRMTSLSKSRRQPIYAAIGPAVGPCCYEVSTELAMRFTERFSWAEEFVTAGNKPHLDLPGIAGRQLQLAGIINDSIETLQTCTVCGSIVLHSFRRSGEKAGRQLSAIAPPLAKL
jgi:purine-nucleoside/S-methyl-5'-thioadenosine phosphorylase / adenosine deaminase